MTNNLKNTLALLAPAVLVIVALIYFSGRTKPAPAEPKESTMSISDSNTKKTYASVPAMQLEEGKDYKAVMHTNLGDINIDLFEDQTPITVNNFVFLSKEKFYDSTRFHRIIKGFMIQGGDPLGNGTGGPGYRFDDEPITEEYTKGTIAMANAGPDTNGSQFFILHEDYPLPKNYVIFGRASDESSLQVIDSIANIPVAASTSGEPSSPTQEITINSVDIIAE
ncbi:MAG: peptidylprolyl isomerase [Patescibacteria group bacterium]|jgi:cyclophilin family peptidyl-prolyl cis-trans isomerase